MIYLLLMILRREIKFTAIAFVAVLLSFIFSDRVFADPIQDWSSATSLPYKIASHTSFSAKGKISVIGGSAVTGQSKFDVKTSTPSADGELGGWITTSLVPNALIWHTTTLVEDTYVYVLGGKEENPGSARGEVNKVYKGELDASGKVISWQNLTPLPGSRALGASVVSNNRIYYAGGFNNTGRKSDIFYADILSDGSLGSWTTSAISLPQALYGFSMLEHDGYIYIIGGNNASNNSLNKVYKSTVNPDGSLSPWIELNSLPLTNFRGHALVLNNRILLVGGEHGAGAYLDDVYYADILPGGIISDWTQSQNNLPIAVSGGSIARVGDYIYLSGGLTTGGNYLDTVYAAKIESSTNLPVTYYKQTDPEWGNDLYDSADLWATDPSFSRWGCAVTSAAMVFDYYGLKNISEDLDTDPKSLNEWLKNQPDGYVSNGNVNWLALTRLSKQTADINEVDFEALEFSRINSSDQSIVRSGIDESIPSILRVPGHFVVGKGYSDENILINDPYYERTDLTEYENSFQNISQFIPSSTDLSYLMFTINQEVDIKVINENGEEVGSLIIEEPITDPSGGATSTAKPLKIVYLQKPATGEYKIEISSDDPSEYILEAFLYDENGEVMVFNFEESVNEEPDRYILDYNKNEVDESNLEKELIVTYDSLIKDIESLYKDKKLKLGAYISLNVKTKLAKSFSSMNKVELRMLSDLKKEVNALYKGRQISNQTRNYLIERIDKLIENI